MDVDARNSFRSAVVEPTPGILSAGLERLPVQLTDESPGGMSLLAQRSPDCSIDTECRLDLDDGRQLLGIVRHVDGSDAGFHIGFQRKEMVAEQAFDLREYFTVQSPRRRFRRTYVIVAVIGLICGLAFNGPAWRRMIFGVTSRSLLTK